MARLAAGCGHAGVAGVVSLNESMIRIVKILLAITLLTAFAAVNGCAGPTRQPDVERKETVSEPMARAKARNESAVRNLDKLATIAPAPAQRLWIQAISEELTTQLGDLIEAGRKLNELNAKVNWFWADNVKKEGAIEWYEKEWFSPSQKRWYHRAKLILGIIAVVVVVGLLVWARYRGPKGIVDDVFGGISYVINFIIEFIARIFRGIKNFPSRFRDKTSVGDPPSVESTEGQDEPR